VSKSHAGGFHAGKDGVLIPEGKREEEFAYSDGDEVEARLAAAVAGAGDTGTGSLELQRAILDFPSRYHLSSQRANLLRPLRDRLRGRVLEVGAGCGALTRWLGEQHLEVWALEGSRRRAAICRCRCRDLANVAVVCENFDDFATELLFDVVLLAGVLEYSEIYAGGPAAMLARARELLAPGGVVVVAIENQLGMKYFAGAPEDHVGTPFHGIHDLYAPGGVRTYGKGEMEELLRVSGLPAIEFFFPFPDYKFPRVVLREGACSEAGIDAGSLIRRCGAEDQAVPHVRLFSEEMAWPLACRNRLLEDMANSFLIVAGAEASGLRESGWPVAWIYAEGRRRCFAKETRVLPGGEAGPATEIERLFPDEPQPDGPYRMVSVEKEWEPGRLHIEEYIELVNREGWRVDDVAAWARHWADLLRKASTDGETVPANYVDFLPANLVRGGNCELRPFDLEWEARGPVPLRWVLLRGLIWSLGSVRSVAQPAPGVPLRLADLLPVLFRRLGFPASRGELESLLAMEVEFQKTVTGLTMPPGKLDSAIGPVRVNSTELARRLVDAERECREAAEGARLYRQHLEVALASYRGQRAWQLMLLFRKLYTHVVREGPRGWLKAARFFLLLPFRGIPNLGAWDLTFPRLEEYLSIAREESASAREAADCNRTFGNI
jgi:SAM-dependent methyltransferase